MLNSYKLWMIGFCLMASTVAWAAVEVNVADFGAKAGDDGRPVDSQSRDIAGDRTGCGQAGMQTRLVRRRCCDLRSEISLGPGDRWCRNCSLCDGRQSR